MKRDFSAFAKKGFVLLDGGFGTELQKHGLPGGVAPGRGARPIFGTGAGCAPKLAGAGLDSGTPFA